jgi:hypothetical protein
MKNTIKILGIITLILGIGFSITACAGFINWLNTPVEPKDIKSAESAVAEQGTITLTGLDEYNGRFVYVSGLGDNDKEFVGAVIFNESNDMMIPRSFIGGEIVNGRVTMPVWQVESSLYDEDFTEVFTYMRYNGSGSVDVVVMIWDEAEVYLGRYSFPLAEGTASVIFDNGIGEGAADIGESGLDEYSMFEK